MTNMFKSIVLILTCLISTNSAFAQEDPQQILEHARDAIKESTGFSAQFKMFGDGGSLFAKTLPSVQGRFIFGELESFGRVIHVVGESKEQQDSTPEAIDILITKDKYQWTSFDEQIIYEASKTGRTPKLPSASKLVFLDVFLQDDPFAQDTLNAQSISLGAPTTITGTPCDTVVIKRATPKGKSSGGADSYTDVTWHIGKKDKLPRRVDRITDAGMVKITLVFELGSIRNTPPPTTQLDIARPSSFEFKSFIRKPRPKTDTNTNRVTQPKPTQQTTKPAQPAKPRIRNAPEFSFTTVQGTQINNQSQADKITMLYFWGSWCAPCNESTPLVSELSKDFQAQGVDVFGLGIREFNEDQTKSDFESADNHHTLVLDGADLTNALRVRMFPTIVIINSKGVITFQESIKKGYSASDMVEDAKKSLETLLKDS